MRKALLALLGVGALAAVSTTVASTPAEAWGGCGPYRHPTPYGCRLNGGPVYGYGWHRPVYGYGYWHRPYYHRYGYWRRW